MTKTGPPQKSSSPERIFPGTPAPIMAQRLADKLSTIPKVRKARFRNESHGDKKTTK